MSTSTPPALSTLSDLVALIPARSFYEQHSNVVGKPTNSKYDGKEYSGSCPVCFGTDRFKFWDSGRFCCVRGTCRIHGSSPYWFLRDVKGYDHDQALYELNIDPSMIDSYSQREKTVLPLFLTSEEPPNQKWQDQAHTFCHMAEKYLRSEHGKSAREYLHSRGFSKETIEQAHLGLCPDWYIAPLADWGLSSEQLGKTDDAQILIPRGIVLPWYVDGSVWKIQLRRPIPGPDGKMYREVLGSSDCLYNSDTIKPGQPVLLVESELDALSAMQEAGDLVSSVATGSTTKGRSKRSKALLKQASLVLVAYDNDSAGEKGAAEWISMLPEGQAIRWEPDSHDINDMLQNGMDIKGWVQDGLALISVEIGPAPIVETRPVKIEENVLNQYNSQQALRTAFDLLQELRSVDADLEIREDGFHFITSPGWEDGYYQVWADLLLSYANQLYQIIVQGVEVPDIPPAVFYDCNGKEIPPGLHGRVLSFQFRGCASCGGLDWFIDFDNRLTCPCIKEKRLQSLLPRPVTPKQKIPIYKPEGPTIKTYWK